MYIALPLSEATTDSSPAADGKALGGLSGAPAGIVSLTGGTGSETDTLLSVPCTVIVVNGALVSPFSKASPIGDSVASAL